MKISRNWSIGNYWYFTWCCLFLGNCRSSLKLSHFPQSLPLNLTLFKTQQLVAIVVVLFFTHVKLSGKLSGKFSGKCSKLIQNPNDFRLDGKGFFRIIRAGDWDSNFRHIRCRYINYFSTFRVFPFLICKRIRLREISKVFSNNSAIWFENSGMTTSNSLFFT